MKYVVPVEKVNNPTELNDLRKISLTSEYSLIFESVMKEWILTDISPKLDKAQFGNQLGTGTEHLLVKFVDKLYKLLDENKNHSAVIASLIDWSAAFDRQDATLAIQKFIDIGIRKELIPVLASYLSNRKMQVKMKNILSNTYDLPGGGPQGTLIGGLEYIIQSNDNADCVDSDLRFKFVDDLSILELVMFSSIVADYDFENHVPSDIATSEQFIPPEHLKTQSSLDSIAAWTKQNLMKINENKTKYMLFSRGNTEVATRLKVNGKTIDRIEETKLVGVWVTTWLDWEKNTREMCRRAYARMTMLTKLKYVGVPVQDLIDIYVLFIRCILEYCSVVWHSSLTVKQANDIERVQKLALKIIFGEKYESYEKALQLAGLESLSCRRDSKCLQFALKCLLHPVHCEMFPLNPETGHNTRNREHFIVNKAHTESYRQSAIPYLQRKLNAYVNSFS